MEQNKRTFPNLLTKDEAAKSLRITPRTLDKFVAKGDVCPVRIGARVLFTESEIARFVAAKTVHIATAGVLATA